MTNTPLTRAQTMEEFERAYSDPSLLQIHDADQMPSGDVLKTEEIVAGMQVKVQRALAQSELIGGIEHRIFSEQITDLMYSLKIRAIALDRIFNNPPREEYSSARNGPSVCVYDGLGELELVNGTYLKLVGLNSAEEAKQLVRDKQLIGRIYTPETAAEVYQFVSTIVKNGGYAGKIFPLANNNAARWTSRYNPASGGNVRVAEDVTGIIDIPPPLPTEGIEDISFQFSQLTEKFSRMIDTIMTLDTEGEILLSYLKNLASVGDIIVDQSPFLVVIKEGNTFISVNKNYVAATGYTRREIETQDPVLYFSSQAAQVKARLESLNNVPHYNDSFRMRRKDGQGLDISWDTFRIDNSKGPMTTVRIGSMIDSAEAIEANEWVRKQNLS